ncbi:MAG: hypothetical protein ACXAD7_18585 [Candidatus Kariarchaeaceae archaeon]
MKAIHIIMGYAQVHDDYALNGICTRLEVEVRALGILFPITNR